MSRKNLLDLVLIVDLECTCHERGQEPPGFQNEIIEIGIASYDVKTGEIKRGGGIPIRPCGEISQFCTDLTGWTAKKLEYAETLETALPALRTNLGTDQRVWASYGDFDRIQFERECAAKGIVYPFGRRHLNLKTLLAIKEGWDKELGMAEAYEKLGETMEGTHHSGADDAYNIARTLKYIVEMGWKDGSEKW